MDMRRLEAVASRAEDIILQFIDGYPEDVGGRADRPSWRI
jgi:hypothetical protein